MKRPASIETATSVYAVESQLGQGGFGIVYRVRAESGGVFAAKCAPPSPRSSNAIRRFKNELHFCQRNQHKHIVPVLDSGFIQTDEGKVPFYVMPLYDGTLREATRPELLPNRKIRHIEMILDGLAAAHALGIVHRDLKPENILWSKSDDTIVIADFGIAHFAEDALITAVETRPNERLANFQYAAPEQRMRGHAVGPQADNFAVGLMLHELFTGELPVGTNYRQVRDIDSEHAWVDDLVEALIQQDPTRRPMDARVALEDLRARHAVHDAEARARFLRSSPIETGGERSFDDQWMSRSTALKIVGHDYANGQLAFKLNAMPTAQWQSIFLAARYTHNASVEGGPESAQFFGETIRARASEREAPRIAKFFQDYVAKTNEMYAAELAQLATKRREQALLARQREIAAADERARVLRSIQL